MTDTMLKLPSSVARKRDLFRLITEFERIDDALTSRTARAAVGVNQQDEITASSKFSDFVKQNQLDIMNDDNRSSALQSLRKLRAAAPIIHLTFASEADDASVSELVGWLRSSIHVHAVVEVGLQPGLIAGVYVRTPNRVFDYSLKSRLKGQRELLVRQLEAAGGTR